MNAILIIAGTLLPLAGPAATIALGLYLTGWPRWLLLFLGPIVSILPCYIYGGEIGSNGNMLFVVFYALALAFLVLYYPVLVIGLLIRYARRKIRD